jgi:hypothetical protein
VSKSYLLTKTDFITVYQFIKVSLFFLLAQARLRIKFVSQKSKRISNNKTGVKCVQKKTIANHRIYIAHAY